MCHSNHSASSGMVGDRVVSVETRYKVHQMEYRIVQAGEAQTNNLKRERWSMQRPSWTIVRRGA